MASPAPLPMEFEAGNQSKKGCKCCPSSVVGKACCGCGICILVVILALGITVAAIYRGKPDVKVKEVKDARGTVEATGIDFSAVAVLEIDNPNNIEVKIVSALAWLYYPQGTTKKLGSGTIDDGTISGGGTSLINVNINVKLTAQEDPERVAQIVAACASSGSLATTVSLTSAKLKILATEFDVPGLPIDQNLDLACPTSP
mmetsp:Transcript_14759/g.32061  ORF Transcript_14759/g.32061 Transcript_14759/m.32061 type:complete len:201 (-) Transcript_14759:24-626(-)